MRLGSHAGNARPSHEALAMTGRYETNRPRSRAMLGVRSFRLYLNWRALLRPRQGAGTEGMGQRHVGGIAAARDEDTPDPRGVVARIERVPPALEIGLEPAREIHGRIGRRQADVGDVAGAVARRDVQAAAERDRQMRVVAANAVALVCLDAFLVGRECS